MQIFGGLLLFLATSFFVLCCFAAVKAPSWSGTPKLGDRKLLAMASNVTAKGTYSNDLQPKSDGLHPTCDGLQPTKTPIGANVW